MISVDRAQRNGPMGRRSRTKESNLSSPDRTSKSYPKPYSKTSRSSTTFRKTPHNRRDTSPAGSPAWVRCCLPLPAVACNGLGALDICAPQDWARSSRRWEAQWLQHSWPKRRGSQVDLHTPDKKKNHVKSNKQPKRLQQHWDPWPILRHISLFSRATSTYHVMSTVKNPSVSWVVARVENHVVSPLGLGVHWREPGDEQGIRRPRDLRLVECVTQVVVRSTGTSSRHAQSDGRDIWKKNGVKRRRTFECKLRHRRFHWCRQWNFSFKNQQDQFSSSNLSSK